MALLKENGTSLSLRILLQQKMPITQAVSNMLN